MPLPGYHRPMSLSMRVAAAALARETLAAERAQQRTGTAPQPHLTPEPPHSVRQHHALSSRSVDGFAVYSVAPMAFAPPTPDPAEATALSELPPQRSATRACLYLHAGGFRNTIRPQAWAFIDQIVEAGVRVDVPIYGLLPEHGAAQAVPLVRQVYADLVSQHGEDNVSVIADSAGGALAVGALLLGGDAAPRHLILNAPWLDLALTHPRTAEFEQRDPKLRAAPLRAAGEQWASGYPGGLENPEVNPAAALRPESRQADQGDSDSRGATARSDAQFDAGRDARSDAQSNSESDTRPNPEAPTDSAGLQALLSPSQRERTHITIFCGDRDLSWPDAHAAVTAFADAGMDATLVDVPGGFHMYHLASVSEGRRDRARMVDAVARG